MIRSGITKGRLIKRERLAVLGKLGFMKMVILDKNKSRKLRERSLVMSCTESAQKLLEITQSMRVNGIVV